MRPPKAFPVGRSIHRGKTMIEPTENAKAPAVATQERVFLITRKWGFHEWSRGRK